MKSDDSLGTARTSGDFAPTSSFGYGDRAHSRKTAVVRVNQNHAGIYGTVTRIGRLAVGQALRLHPCATDLQDLR
jgi:hypothetical protein